MNEINGEPQNTPEACGKHLSPKVKKSGMMIINVRDLRTRISQFFTQLGPLDDRHWENMVQLLGAKLSGFNWAGALYAPCDLKDFVDVHAHMFVCPADEARI